MTDAIFSEIDFGPLKEFLEDYASPETKELGERIIKEKRYYFHRDRLDGRVLESMEIPIGMLLYFLRARVFL